MGRISISVRARTSKRAVVPSVTLTASHWVLPCGLTLRSAASAVAAIAT